MTQFRKPTPCTVDGCPSFVWSRGWCITHYSRARKHGDPNVVLPHTKPPLNSRPKRERWEAKIRHSDHATNGCCEWVGAHSSFGYGQLRTGQRGLIEMAHRLAWEFEVGPIPEGLSVLHRCDNPPCCRPSHLFLGTQKDNMVDAATKNRLNRPSGDTRHHVPRGERLGRIVKLTANDVRSIRARAASGETQVSIAKDFPATRQQIGQIILRRSWSHIE